ncbi:putative glycosyl hydrolase [Golovinomyces cichoracearum]|uniref:Putative glycosyl hydrolase n=1 Tax=Golovinomyces cichoracearum TaxID=62708 RepID=A0A420H7D7_9PEZI|nr:putative glycosyl hydrolase [Golovinomyces cichoracearum]
MFRSIICITIITFISFSTSLANNFSDLPASNTSETRLENWQNPLHKKLYQNGTLFALVEAVDVLQENYFKLWPGVWPSAIDWTSAVVGTNLAGCMRTFSRSDYILSTPDDVGNLINRHFSALSASYFGQNVAELAKEAYDDILWVVLEWLEAVQLVNERSQKYSIGPIGGGWYAQEWVPEYARRAVEFWDLASPGYNRTLCGGGMTWNPRLLPYKNAITNELYISASVAMYLYNGPVIKPQNPKYLNAAIETYNWLMSSNMTNDDGLFVDGYHISGWNQTNSNNTKCDERNEMVYTYNQGVLLSGQLGLYIATGVRSYLEEGHNLLSNTIRATGWDLENGNTTESYLVGNARRPSDKWHGLGRSGILEEACDASATCSQDSQTFKGIFFHHMTKFCSELKNPLVVPEASTADSPLEIQNWHYESCQKYGPWIKHNADAALSTLDSQGRFGSWWGVAAEITSLTSSETYGTLPRPGSIDYRNSGLPQDWLYSSNNVKKRKETVQRKVITDRDDNTDARALDLNDRGRGRTVETQNGGLSVLRALWEIVERPGGK